MSKLTTILLALLLLGCNEKEQAKPPEPPRLDCSVSCDEEKIKEWYQKKYGEPITDFELSAKEVTFMNAGFYDRQRGSRFHYSRHYVSITRTETNVIATYLPQHNPWKDGFFEKLNVFEKFEIELDMEDWLGFVRALYKRGIGEWRPYTHKGWEIDMKFSNKNYLPIEMTGQSSEGTLYWGDFTDIIEDICIKILKKAENPIETKLKEKYQAKFGEPITNIELSTMNIHFTFNKGSYFRLNNESFVSPPYDILIARTETGMLARYYELGYQKRIVEYSGDVEFDIDDWLDFIKIFHSYYNVEWRKCCKLKQCSDQWELRIFFSDKLAPDAFEGYEVCPPNWNGFQKVMYDMAAKINRKAGK